MLLYESAIIGPSSSLAYDEQISPSEADVASASEEVVFEGRSVSCAVPHKKNRHLPNIHKPPFGNDCRNSDVRFALWEDQGECSERT
jgi:predicted RNA methylase